MGQLTALFMTKKKSEESSQTKLSKKERAELERVQHQKHKQEKQKKQTSSKIPFSLPFVTGIILVTVASIFFVFVGFFLFQNMIAPRDIAEFLPAKETVALLEVNTADRNFKQFFQELQAYPAFREDALAQMLLSETGINFDTDILPWFGKKAGLAFLNVGGNTGRVIFLEMKNRKKTPEIAGQSLNFIDRYAVFSDNSDLLSQLVRVGKKDTALSKNPWYLRARDHLGNSAPIFAYGNIELLISRKSFGTLAFFAELSKVYPGIGFTGSFEKGTLLGKSFLNIANNTLTSAPSFGKQYDGTLLPLISQENLLFLMGGRNFPKEFQETLALMNTVHPSAGIVAEGMLRAQKDEYLNPFVSLENDVYPLFRDEYVISVHQTDAGPSFDLALNLNDPSSDREKLLKLIAFSEKVETSDTSIATLRFSDRDFFYAFSPNNDIFLFSNDKDFVAYGLKSLNSKTYFSLPTTENILSVSHDITLIHPDFFRNFFDSEQLRSYLEPFNFFIFGNNRSDSGVSTLFTLSLK